MTNRDRLRLTIAVIVVIAAIIALINMPGPSRSRTSTLATTAGRRAGPSSAASQRQVPSKIPSPPQLPGKWRLIFNSTFDRRSLNLRQWCKGFYCANGITRGDNPDEQECYSPSQVSLTGSALAITAIARRSICDHKAQPYESGMIMTYTKFSFTYGYMEARIWLPPGPDGIADWPAFWAVGNSWPKDGEIDVLEGLGGHACVHYITHHGTNPGTCVDGTFADGWHVFAADWEPHWVRFYYDGREVFDVTGKTTSAPMFLVLNMALATAITRPDTAPATMEVQYVRVWQH
ncbi:MAG: glycoside hydrolase family 16 protein [Acidimicrobiales bacterium]